VERHGRLRHSHQPDATSFARRGIDLEITTRTAARWQEWVETGTADNPSGYSASN
jgi:hypothetical protein